MEQCQLMRIGHWIRYKGVKKMAYKIGQVVQVNNENFYTQQGEDYQVLSGAPEMMQIIGNKYGIQYLNHFGIQARPGCLFTLNDEVIMIGRSGVYELDNDLVQIESLQVLSKGTYIIDFKY